MGLRVIARYIATSRTFPAIIGVLTGIVWATLVPMLGGFTP